MNARIVKAELRAKKARENLQNVIKSVQKSCKHPKDFVYEASYRPESELFYALPPFRVCSKCGLAETGWGIGYHTLPNTELTINRDIGEDYSRYTISEEEKCSKLKKAREFEINWKINEYKKNN